MAVPPTLPNLAPADMKWARWVTDQVQGHSNTTQQLQTNLASAQMQHSTTASSAANVHAVVGLLIKIPVPEGPPQVPTAPTLYTDHGTVTVKWDGQVHANAAAGVGSLQTPYSGFSHVNVLRADVVGGPYVNVGTHISIAGSFVDGNVTVGNTYWYELITTDTLGASSAPSDPASIVVVGVDLGSLAVDVANAITAAQAAGDAGIAAGQAGQAAAATANTNANSAAGQAASALSAAQTAQARADQAYNAAETATGTNQVYLGTTQPTDTTGQLLWIDTTGGANTPKKYNTGTSTWVVITDKAATDAATAAASAATAASTAQTTANTAVTNAQSAQTTANSALTSANGKNKVYYQATQPSTSGNIVGDTWWNTTSSAYVLNVWNGSAWTVSAFGTNAIAAQAVTATQLANGTITGTQLATAVNTSITTAQSTATTAQTTANAKNSSTYSTVAPGSASGTNLGDIWFVQNASGAVTAQYVSTGSAWVSQTLTNTVIATLDAGKITTGTLAAARIGANSISASQMVAGTITAASGIIASLDAGTITTGTLNASRIGANSIAASQMIAGTITAASGILGTASVVQANIANLAVGTAQIADLAVADAKIATLTGSKIIAGTITTGKFQAGSIVTNDIAAGAIDTNRLAAGVITADKMTLGAIPQNGSSIDRVPALLTDGTFWPTAISTATIFTGRLQGAQSGVTSNSGYGAGLTVNNGSFCYFMKEAPAPQSSKLFLTATTSIGAPTNAYVREFSATTGNTYTDTAISVTSSGVSYMLNTGTTNYYVYGASAAGAGYTLITSFHIFEVIGAAAIGQSAQLSPAGLQLYDSNAQLAVDLTTNAAQYLSIVNNTGSEPQTVAAIDSFGNAGFTEVSAQSGFDISGQPLTDVTSATSLFNSTPNGSAWDPNVPLLDRLPRGVIYDVTWLTLNGYSVGTNKPSLRIAQDSFVLEDGRQYMINLQSGGLQMSVPSGNSNMYFELQLSLTPITNITTGVNVSRGLVAAGTNGMFNTQSPIFTASVNTTTINNENRILPANTQIYWQLDLSSGAAASAWSLAEFGYSRGLSIIDMGSNTITRPINGADAPSYVDNRVQIAAGGSSPAGSGSAGTSSSSTTTDFTAKDSRTWNNGGSNIVTGSGQYNNGLSMYVGTGASSMGSWFGLFQNIVGSSMYSVVAGKTITAASLKLRNNYTYSSNGSTNQFGTASTNSAPSTIGAPANNVFSASFSKGQTKSITLGSAIRSGLSSGGVQSFVIGVQSGYAGIYGYYAGAHQSGPPVLTLTYH